MELRLPSVHLCSLSKQHQDNGLGFLSRDCRKQLKVINEEIQVNLVNKPSRNELVIKLILVSCNSC